MTRTNPESRTPNPGKRRRLVGVALLLILLCAAALWFWRRSEFTDRGAPPALAGANLILITIDTLRADRVGAGFTPSLDRLAAEGVTFTRARAAAPLTLPSHVTIMSGLLPPAHGVRENGTARLAGTRATLASLLKAAGYDTAAFVGAYVLDRRFGLDRGFDRYDDQIPRDPRAIARLEAERKGGAVVDSALRWLADRTRAGRTTPFFVWVHLYDPHAPYDPPAEFAARAGGDQYNGEVAYADAQAGRLIAAIEAAAPAPLVVAVAGDHGESLGEHGERTHGMLLYEGAVHVPLVMSVKGGTGGARGLRPGRVTVPASLQDLAPTLLRLLGLTPDPAMTGRDLLAPIASPDADAYSESEYPRVAGWHPLYALTGERWKLIASSANELYDLISDPGERQNVASAQPAVVRGMLTRAAELRGSNAGAASGSRSIPPEAAERLRALGYVSGSTASAPTGREPNPAETIAAWTQFETALSLVAADRAKEALPILARLAEEHPDALVFQSTRAQALLRAGNARGAVDSYRRAVARWPSDQNLLHDLAVAAREAGLRGEALRVEQAAIALDPDAPAPHNGHGLLLVDAGRPREAAAAFERATALDPTNAAYLTNLGNAHRAIGDITAAEQAYRRALEVDARHADALNGMGVLLVQTRRPAAAVAWLERALEASPNFVEARLNLGIAYQESGQTAKAIEAYRAVLAAPPTFKRERDAAAKLLGGLRQRR